MLLELGRLLARLQLFQILTDETCNLVDVADRDLGFSRTNEERKVWRKKI